MRENRLAKLAGLKKIAQETAYETAYETEFENDDAEKIYEKIAADIRALNTENKTVEGGRVFYIEAAGYYLGKLGETESSIQSGLKAAVGLGLWYGRKIPTDTLRALLDFEEAGLYDKFIEALNKGLGQKSSPEKDTKDKATETKPGGRRRVPEATRPYTQLTAPTGTKLTETAGSITYYYIIYATNSFGFNTDGKEKYKIVDNSYSKWEDAAKTLNALYEKSIQAPAAVTAPVAAATPAAVTPAPAEATTQANPELVSKIKEVLKRAKKEPLDIKSLGNEMLQIKQLDTSISSRGIDGLGSLAALVASRVGNLLPNLERATVVQIQGAKRRVLAANERGFLSMDVNTILDSINDIYGEYNRAPSSFLNKYFTKPAAPATAPAPAPTATPAAQAAQADDGLNNKDASLNKKFIKAATLRRLKIRSQMEAAIDSSAQMGRARVS
jgi:hypothetical protein